MEQGAGMALFAEEALVGISMQALIATLEGNPHGPTFRSCS
jgi:hypothetical protein